MKQRVRVLLLIPHLGGGGAEQVTAQLAQGLSKEKYEIHLGLVTDLDAGTGALPEWVTIHRIGATRGACWSVQTAQGWLESSSRT